MDEQFHDVIYEATGNKRLIQLLNNLRQQMYSYRLEYIKDEKQWDVLREEHKRLVKAIEEKDIATAKAVTGHHIDNQEQTISARIQKATV